MFLHRFAAADGHSVEAVVQVIGPIQHLRLGTVNRGEEYVIPVSNLTYTTDDNDYSSPTSAMLLVTPHDRLTLVDLSLDRRTANQRDLAEGSAVDRWAILPAATAGMPREALADCATAASRRASNAFHPV